MQILTIPQIDGATRYIAVSDDDARAVRRDPAQIECADVLGSADVSGDSVTYGLVGPLWREVPQDVRDALRDAALR